MEQFASLAVVEAAVRREVDAHERRADAADTRAGLVLGFAGLVASVGPGDVWPPLALVVRLAAGVAALLALSALSTNAASEFDAELVRRRYLSAHPLRTRLVLLDTDVELTRLIVRRLALKLARLRLASGLLIAAVALTTTAGTVEVIA